MRHDVDAMQVSRAILGDIPGRDGHETTASQDGRAPTLYNEWEEDLGGGGAGIATGVTMVTLAAPGRALYIR